jgi:hypothetical protein
LVDRSAAAEFIIRRLCRPVSLGAGNCRAAAETEHPFAGDAWFWTDDNAKIIEFLARPEFAGRYRKDVEETLHFVRAMCRGPFILRRLSAPRLVQTEQRGSEASFYHSLMHLRCDLSRGVILAGIRFHDDRTADNLVLHTNCVDFTHRHRRYSLAVESAIDAVATKLDGNRLELRFAGDLYFRPRRRSLRVGRVHYNYTVDSRSMAIGVEVVLEVDPAAEVADVVLTVGHDHLSHAHNNVHYSNIFVKQGGREPLRFKAGEPGRRFLPVPGAAYYSISQSEIAGFALAAHAMPREGADSAEIELLVRQPGMLHFVRARYRFDGPCRGRRLVAAEDKMLTAGGFYGRVDDYSDLLREAIATRSLPQSAIDFSISYDYGAELNAFAHWCALLAADGSNDLERQEARALFDTYLGHYFALFVGAHRSQENTIFSRQLAFVILALVKMFQVTGGLEYRQRLAALCDVMFEFEKRFEDVAGAAASGFLMGTQSHRIVFVDCHSAALLALTEAARHIDDPRFAPAIDRGLGCYCIETTKIDWHDGPRKIDVIGVAWTDDSGARRTNHGLWNYHSGLTLRFFASLRNSTAAAVRAVAAKHRDRIKLFEMIIRWHITRSLSRADGMTEIRSSLISTETNSETQPWASLGLLDRGWA